LEVTFLKSTAVSKAKDLPKIVGYGKAYRAFCLAILGLQNLLHASVPIPPSYKLLPSVYINTILFYRCHSYAAELQVKLV
jgi:hypothetical protein